MGNGKWRRGERVGVMMGIWRRQGKQGAREREVFDYTEEVWIITRGARVSDLKWRFSALSILFIMTCPVAIGGTCNSASARRWFVGACEGT